MTVKELEKMSFEEIEEYQVNLKKKIKAADEELEKLQADYVQLTGRRHEWFK